MISLSCIEHEFNIFSFQCLPLIDLFTVVLWEIVPLVVLQNVRLIITVLGVEVDQGKQFIWLTLEKSWHGVWAEIKNWRWRTSIIFPRSFHSKRDDWCWFQNVSILETNNRFNSFINWIYLASLTNKLDFLASVFVLKWFFQTSRIIQLYHGLIMNVHCLVLALSALKCSLNCCVESLLNDWWADIIHKVIMVFFKVLYLFLWWKVLETFELLLTDEAFSDTTIKTLHTRLFRNINSFKIMQYLFEPFDACVLKL